MYSESSKKNLFYLIGDFSSLYFSFFIILFANIDIPFNNKLIFVITVTLSGLWLLFNNKSFYNYHTLNGIKKIKISFEISFITNMCFLLISFLSYYFTKDYFYTIRVDHLILKIIILWLINLFFREIASYIEKKSISEKKNVILLINKNKNHIPSEYLIQHGYKVLGYMSTKEKVSKNNHNSIKENVKLNQFLAHNVIHEVIVDFEARDYFMSEYNYFCEIGIPVSMIMTNRLENDFSSIIVDSLGEDIVVTSALNYVDFRMLLLKRFFDIIISIFGLFLTFIVAIIIYPIVQSQSKGPLLFKQKRVGKNGEIFEMYKFRSMYLDAEKHKSELLRKNELKTDLMFKLENDPRIFPFGHKLRIWSIDELPQFINVLRGDMSIVGTRPPTIEEYQKYDLHHFKRLLVKPGITGMWQVNGRSDIKNFEEVVKLDMTYINNWSIWLDLKIFLKTFDVVLRKKGSK
ncbi:sugar transferase [Streptococcus marimammalium]|uniref:sugar transferase n=1 Tax=Streptococcus marimammalium TaxID=269666 RepID=UPI000370392A|nr:exopolysaccharide biosynthesis polyprenyl glycosylphosphotransferase [Streptococcus marimammalium]